MAIACKLLLLLLNSPRLFTDSPSLWRFLGAVLSLAATYYCYVTISEKRTLKQVISSGNFGTAVAAAYLMEALFENENPDILSLQALTALVFYGDICFELFDKSTIMMFTAAKLVLLLFISPSILAVIGVIFRSIAFSWLLEKVSKHAISNLHQSILAADKTNQQISRTKILTDNVNCALFILSYNQDLEIEYTNALGVSLAKKLAHFAFVSENQEVTEDLQRGSQQPNRDKISSTNAAARGVPTETEYLKNGGSFVAQEPKPAEGQLFHEYLSLPKSNQLVKALTDLVSNMQEQGEELSGITLLDNSSAFEVSIQIIDWAPDKKLLVEIRKDPHMYSIMAKEAIKTAKKCALYLEHKSRSLSNLLEKNRLKKDLVLEKTKTSITLFKNQLIEKSLINSSFLNVLELGLTEECENKLVLFDLSAAERLFKNLGFFVNHINQSRRNSMNMSITNPLTKGCMMDLNALSTFLQSLLAFSIGLNSGNKFSLKMSAKKANESSYYLEFFYEGSTSESFCSEVFSNLFSDTVQNIEENLLARYPTMGMAINNMFFLRRHLKMKSKIFGGQFASSSIITRQTTGTGSLQLGRTNSLRANQGGNFSLGLGSMQMGSGNIGNTNNTSSLEQIDSNAFIPDATGASNCTLRFTMTFTKADLRFGDLIEKKYNKVIYEENHSPAIYDELQKAIVLECDFSTLIEEWERVESNDSKNGANYSALDDSRSRTLERREGQSIQSLQAISHPLGSKMGATFANQQSGMPGVALIDYRANPLEFLSVANEPELGAINSIVSDMAATQLALLNSLKQNTKNSPLALASSIIPVPTQPENRSPSQGIYSPHSSSTTPKYKRVVSISPRMRNMQRDLFGESTPKMIKEVVEGELPEVPERGGSEENLTVQMPSINDIAQQSVGKEKHGRALSSPPQSSLSIKPSNPEGVSAQSIGENQDKVNPLPQGGDYRSFAERVAGGSQKRVLTLMPSMLVKSNTLQLEDDESRTPKLPPSISALPVSFGNMFSKDSLPGGKHNTMSAESESKATLSNMDPADNEDQGGLLSQRDMAASLAQNNVPRKVSQGDINPCKIQIDSAVSTSKEQLPTFVSPTGVSSQKHIQKKPTINLTGSSVLENLRQIEETNRLGVSNLQDTGTPGFRVSAHSSDAGSARNVSRNLGTNPLSRKNSKISADPASFEEAVAAVPAVTIKGDSNSTHKRNYSLSVITTEANTLTKQQTDNDSVGLMVNLDDVQEPSRDLEDDQSSADESRDKVLEMPFPEEASGLNSTFWTPILGRSNKLGSTPLPVRRETFLELMKDSKERAERAYRSVFDHQTSKSGTTSLSPTRIIRSIRETGRRALDDSLIDYRSCEDFRIFETVSNKLLSIVFSEAITQGFFGLFNPPVEQEFLSGAMRPTAARGKSTQLDLELKQTVVLVQQQEKRREVLEHMHSRRRQTWILDIESQIKNNTVPLILIVDDTDSDRMIIEEMILEEYPDAKIDHASNGLEAFENVQRKYMNRLRYDLVFMDMNMAEHDGTAGISMIRGFERRNKIQRMCNICAVSGDEFEETKADEEQIMFKVKKPLTFELLKRILKKVLVTIGSPVV